MAKDVKIIRVQGDKMNKTFLGGCGNAFNERLAAVILNLSGENDKIVPGGDGRFTIFTDGDLNKQTTITVETLSRI